MQEDLTKQHQGGGETPQGENSTRLLQKEETSDSVPRERGISTHVRLTKPSSNISFPHKIMMQHTTRPAMFRVPTAVRGGSTLTENEERRQTASV